MSKVKINTNLFLEVAEFKRLQQQFDDWGFKRHIHSNTMTYGIVKDTYIPELGQIEDADNFYVSKLNTCGEGKVTVKPGFIIDKNAEFVVNPRDSSVDVPSDGSWYWIKVSHRLSNEEQGTVSIDTFGNLSGIGTEFTEILRGQPNFPSKIRFLDSQNGNVNDYEVVSITDDNTAILSGDFQNESNMKFAIVGTFTPGYPVPASDELIFQYDDCTLTLVPETTLNQPPVHLADYEFMLARVTNNGTTIITQDKRINWWRPWGEWWLNHLDRNFDNPLIGVDGTQFMHKNSTKSNNAVLLSWGFRFSSYTIDTSLKKMSVLIGEGGVFKDTSFFNNSEFNGWRVYAKNGTWRTIIDSQKSGSQIVLTLDVLDPNDYGSADKLFIAPPFEAIEIRSRKDSSIIDINDQDNNGNSTEPFPWPNLERRFEFAINVQQGRLFLPALDDCYKYNLTYRYRTFEGYTDWMTFPDDVIGFYSEESYDEYGNLKIPIDRVRKPYVGHAENGFIQVCESPDSFQNFKERIDTGDLVGVNTTSLDNATPIVELEVGVSKQYQHYKGSLTLSADMFIHLKRQKPNGDYFREGNFFLIHLEQWVTLDGFRLRIVEDYLNPTSFNLLSELTENDLFYVRNNTSDDSTQSQRRGIMIKCTYNENNKWIISFDSEIRPKGTVAMLSNGAGNSNFDSSGVGIRKGFWGWRIMNGNNGTINMNSRFPMGVNSVSSASAVGGTNSVTLDPSMLPNHTHTFSGTTTSNGDHSHNVAINYRDGTAVNSSGIPAMRRGGTNAGVQIINGFEGGYVTTGGSHVHTFSGTTSAAGGSSTPSTIDKRPQFGTFVFIEKYV